jgi:galactose mutarotase-like enzyme
VRGTDISFDWAYRGMQACVLENDILRVVVLPSAGAKVQQLIYKPADRDLLYHHPRVAVRQPVFGVNVDNWWTGGIDECVPTGAPCVVDGEELPYLGEAWSMPWTAQQVSATQVRLERTGVITPFHLERTMELRPGEPFVRMRHVLTNTGMAPFPFIWGIHPGLPVGPATRIQVPARLGVVQDSWPGDRLGRSGSTYRWPNPALTEPGEQPGRTWDLHYATELAAGWLAVWDGGWQCGFGMTFPHEIFRCVWVWLVDGGWRGIRCVAVEPWTGYPTALSDAIAAGHATTLAAGQSLSAETRLIGFATATPVTGFDEAGQPLK